MDCFGGEDCYSVAFGVPALLMIVATIIIIIGKDIRSHQHYYTG